MRPSGNVRRMAGLRIDGAVVVPMDGPRDRPCGRIRKASIRVRGDRIVALGDLTPEPGEVVLDASGLVATPGFVQGHVHPCQTLFRGLADDLALMDWLRRRIWPLEAAHDAASIRASARVTWLELLAGGTTTAQAMETVRHTEESFGVAEEFGVTAIVGNCLMDLQGPGVPADLPMARAEALAACEALADAFDGRGRLHYAVSPRFLLSCSDELSREAAALARGRGLRIHTHAAEHPGEIEEVRRRTGTDYVLALRDQGLLTERTSLAHCVHTNEAERRALRETGAAVLHCPSTNLKLGSGIAPIADYRDLDLRIALGADGAPCNNRLSALTEMRQAALLQALAAGPGAWPAQHALAAATCDGARALGLDDVGVLAPGRRADLVLFDLSSLEPDGDPVSRLVYSATEAAVRHVLVGGRFAVREGRFELDDAERIRARAVEERERLLRRADLPA